MTIRPRGQSSSKPVPEPAPKSNIILDSGAYSAWRSGKPIDLDKYCDYLLENAPWIGSYVALDVINPGRPEEAAKASFDNYMHMRKRGLDPIPVFHVGEDIAWLYRMLDAGGSYIGLSASSLVSRNQVDDWYALAWSHLVNSEGLPTIKAHAFGEGRPASLRQFPWYSADTTSWIYTAQRTGQVTLPDGQSLSMRNDGGGSKSSPAAAGLDRIEDKIFQDLLREHGINPKAFEADGITAKLLRTYLTAIYYVRIQDQMRALHPIRHRPQGFLHNGFNDKPLAAFDKFNMHLVIGTNDTAFAIVAKLGHPNVLISYFMLAGVDPIRSATNGHLVRCLAQFAADPQAAVQAEERWLRYYTLLEEYVKQ